LSVLLQIRKDTDYMDSLQKDVSTSQTVGSDVQQTAEFEDEINSKEYLEVVLKRKKLILSVFVISVVASAITSLCLPKPYKASASIMVMRSRIPTTLSPTRISLEPEKTERGGYAARKPTISIPTDKSLLKSSAVLERAMAKLKAGGRMDKELALEGLSGKLEVENMKETNVLQLAVVDKKPGRAKDIANTWANEYAQYSLEIITEQVRGSGDFVVEEFNLAKENLAKAEQAAKDSDVKERLWLMEIELKENQDQLESHYAKVHKLDFMLKEKKNLLKKVYTDIVAMTWDSVWLGSWN